MFLNRGIVLVLIAFACTAAGPLQAADDVDFEGIFKDKDACFELYDMTSHRFVSKYNDRRCAERVFACTTFKVPIALMAFNERYSQGREHSHQMGRRKARPRRLEPGPGPHHVAEVFGGVGFAVDYAADWSGKIKKYLADFHYGNQDMSGGITTFWLSSTLKISADKQI